MPTDAKPLSDKSKQYIFDELNKQKDNHPNNFRQKLIKAACDNSTFPSVFTKKLVPLQFAYQAHQDDPDQKVLLDMLLQNYFDKQGLSLFIHEVLEKPFIVDEWSDDFARKLAGDDIQIPDETIVEATIKDGKVYWCVHYGAYKISYRREGCVPLYNHKTFIDEAREQNRTFTLTWEKFRAFKDAGKRTGTVVVSEDRFASQFPDKPRCWADDIHRQLTEVGILDPDTYKLSSGWYPLSQVYIDLENVTGHEYQRIATALKDITNNPAYQNEFSPGLSIYRPARAVKRWAGTGLIQNEKKNNVEITQSKPWDVAVYSELHVYAPSGNGYEADHIPSKAQIKTMYASETLAVKNHLDYVSSFPQYGDMRLIINNLQKRLEFFDKNGDGSPGFWCIYVKKEQHDLNPTTRLLKTVQATLTPYDSIEKYIERSVDDLKQSKITTTEFIHILGAFRYLVSRMCKDIENVDNRESKKFIHNEPNRFFSTPDAKKQLDDLFITKMQYCMGR